MGLTAVGILVVDERGHVAALVHNEQDDCRAIRRIEPLVGKRHAVSLLPC